MEPDARPDRGAASTCSATRSAATRSIHLTGTNGKTSTARMIDALLQRVRAAHRPVHQPAPADASGERISLDGEPISAGALRRDLRRGRAVRRPGRRRGTTMPLTLVRGAHRDGVRRVRRRAGGRRRWSRSGWAARWDATNVVDGTVAVITPIGLDHTEYLGDTIVRDRPGEGRHHQAGCDRGAAPRRSRRWPRSLLRALRRGRRDGRPRGRRVRRASTATVAVGGQRAHAAGPGGVVRRDLPAAARRAPGAERRGGAGRGRGVPRGRARDRPLDPDAVREALRRRSRSPGRLERVRGAPTDPGRRRAQPARHGRALAAALQRGVRLHPAGRRWSRAAPTRTSAGILDRARAGARRDRRHRRTRRRGRCDPDELGALAVEVFGAGPGRASSRVLDDAIEQARASWPRRAGQPRRRRRDRHRLGRSRRGRRARLFGLEPAMTTPVPEISDPTKGLAGVAPPCSSWRRSSSGRAARAAQVRGGGDTARGRSIGGLAVAMVLASVCSAGCRPGRRAARCDDRVRAAGPAAPARGGADHRGGLRAGIRLVARGVLQLAAIATGVLVPATTAWAAGRGVVGLPARVRQE